MNRELNEAIKNLQNHGFEVELDEGKLGRILSIGALAIGSLFSHSNAEIDNLDLKTASVEDVNEIKTALEQENDIDYCKIRGKGLVCKDTNKSIMIYPIESMTGAGISDEITEIVFLDAYSNDKQIGGVIFNYKNGSKKTMTYKIGERYGSISTFDEFDKELSRKTLESSKIENLTNDVYKNVMHEIETNAQTELEQKIIKKYSPKQVSKPKEKTVIYNDDSLSYTDNIKINDIMLKYNKWRTEQNSK